MTLKVEELHSKGYFHLDTLEHSDIGNFIKPYLFLKNGYVFGYFAASFVPLLVFGGMMGAHVARGTFDGEMLGHFFYGFSIAFLLIPLHEWIHGLAYQALGAKTVKYSANFRKLVFFAMADKYVTSYAEFKIIALAPFVVITSLSILLFFCLPYYWSLTMLGVLFVHSSCCGGDFGLLSYLHVHAVREIVTYDDVAASRSYFLVKV